jgi:hypothetical protein
LGDLYANCKDDEEFKDFINYHNLGFPLAYFVREDLASVSDDGARYIKETWELFLASRDLEDVGFTDLDSVLDA